MLLDTKAAKIILWSMAFCLSVLAVLVAVTGWDGTSSTSAAQQQTSEIDSPAITPAETSPNDEPSQDVRTTEPASEPVVTETAYEEPAPLITQNSVFINTQSTTVSPGEEFVLTIEAQIDKSVISGSQIALRFDPLRFQIIRMDTEGVLGSDPLVGVEDIDNETGLLEYAVARRGRNEGPAATPETLAAIHFRVTDSAPEGSGIFTLSEVKLTDGDFQPLAGFEVQNGKLTVIQ